MSQHNNITHQTKNVYDIISINRYVSVVSYAMTSHVTQFFNCIYKNNHFSNVKRTTIVRYERLSEQNGTNRCSTQE